MTADFASTQEVFDTSVTNAAEAARSGGGGFIRYIQAINPNTAQAFLQLFDLVAADVTVGTTTPTQSYLVPAGDGVNSGVFEMMVPMHFNAAISYAATTTSTGSTAPTSNLTLN